MFAYGYQLQYPTKPVLHLYSCRTMLLYSLQQLQVNRIAQRLNFQRHWYPDRLRQIPNRHSPNLLDFRLDVMEVLKLRELTQQESLLLA